MARAFGCDLADPGAPERLIDDVEAALGGVDILVANHGVARQARYEDVDAAVFDHTLAVNLRAPFLLARRALPGMREDWVTAIWMLADELQRLAQVGALPG